VLLELHIAGLGVIGDLDLELRPGLTVVTGETGTGKTMVATGLSLALGGRAGAHVVREGADAARVQARFEMIDDADDWAEDGELVLARTMRADGRGSARIGGQIATVRALAELGARLAEVHGQHQSLRLLEPATQTAFLDRFAGQEHGEWVARWRAEAARLRAARAALAALREDARDRAREQDLVAYQVREIEEVAPAIGETAALESEASRLGHVERLRELAGTALDALAEEDAASDRLVTVQRALEDAAAMDPAAQDLATRGRSLAAEAVELAHDARAWADGLAADPVRLQDVRERIALLRGLQRKYGADDEQVLVFLEEARATLDGLAGADDRIAELEAETSAAADAAASAAAEVSAGRAEAAPRLEAALMRELADLGMPQAGLAVSLVPDQANDDGVPETVELRFSGGAGQALLPLAKAASGGELSRVMLACRSVLADLDDVPTLVFDEIDAGIGGRAGLAVGARLSGLAATRQVIVVTHLPQIACYADRHVRVDKDEAGTTLTVLDDDARVVELSRMLAGLEGSEHAHSHAEELMERARGSRPRAGATT
jgi:DNA repair protein RecN (Recombination protein N)